MAENIDNRDIRSFFVQLVDGQSGCVVVEHASGQRSVTAVCEFIGCDREEFMSAKRAELDEEQVERANKLFSLSIPPDYEFVDLLSWSEVDGLPYRVHTNIELPLMLERKKPLSMFTEMYPVPDGSSTIPEHLFDPYVENGLLSKLEYCEPMPHLAPAYHAMRVVLYALRGEEWRLSAYAMVRNLASKVGWEDNLIRLEGTLLGYAEWQNDVYIARPKG